MRSFDVLDVSDLRFPGGTAHSVAEEVRVQHEAGYSTALLHLNGPLVAKARPVNPKLRQVIEAGCATLLVNREPVQAEVVVVRHPAVLQHATDDAPRVHTERVVVVANAGPRDIDGHEHYSTAAVDAAARRMFGVDPVWAPIGPKVRATIAGDVPAERMVADDWVNIIDVDAWSAPHTHWAGPVPVIGRHSRESAQKWPRDLEVLRQVYPVDDSWSVRVLGGAKPAQRLLGQLPKSWQVLPFGAMAPRDFLAGLDFFVYYHDPHWVEAFGRTILEALAVGRPAILPPHFAELFGEAAIYAEPPEVKATVERLYADREAYLAQVERGQRYVRSWFGHGVHVARIDRLIGTPRHRDGELAGDPPPSTSAAAATPTEPAAPASLPPVSADTGTGLQRVLFITSNGTGMGHLTRLLAVARRSSDTVEPHFLSLSQAVPVVEAFGFGYEYLASSKATGLSAKRWHAYFAQRVGDTIARLRPAVVVFDGTWPYDGIVTVRNRHPGPRWVWFRRGMWYQGKNRDQLAKAAWFDQVIEPGDFASAADIGVTARTERIQVSPLTLLDSDELDDRATARQALGLDPDRRYGLVSLGAGNINSTADDATVAIEAMERLGVQACVTVTAIAARSEVDTARVHRIRDYPLSRRFHAFDVAVSAAGYNSFHELLRFGVPTLFVPNRATQLDDQATRARYAAAHGAAHAADVLDPVTAHRLLSELLDSGPEFAARAAAMDPGNGAADAARLVEKMIDLVPGGPR